MSQPLPVQYNQPHHTFIQNTRERGPQFICFMNTQYISLNPNKFQQTNETKCITKGNSEGVQFTHYNLSAFSSEIKLKLAPKLWNQLPQYDSSNKIFNRK